MMTDFATPLSRWTSYGLGLLVVALVLTGCDAEPLREAEDPSTPTIADYVTEVRALSELEGVVSEVGLVSTLENDGPFTLFAPADGAFSPPIDPSLNQKVATRVVQHHVVAGEETSSGLSNGQSLTPLAGNDLTVSVDEGGDANVLESVNRAAVTNADANAANGVVHVVDGLLANAVDRATLTPRFTLFARLVKEADLEDPLASGDLTIFAPTNDALLDALDDNDNGELESDEIPSNAADVLQYHVLDGAVLAEDLPTSETDFQTLEGSDVTVVRDADTGAVTLNPNAEAASVTTADVEVDNGVIHGIDRLLTP